MMTPEDLARLRASRLSITEARTDGATIPDLMETAGRSRQGIYNALRRTR